MNINRKTAVIAILSIAIIAAAISLVQSTMTAQPPVTTRTIPASPDAEWVALQTPTNYPMGGPSNVGFDADLGWYYVVLYNTKTGKVKHTTWPARKFFGSNDMRVAETP